MNLRISTRMDASADATYANLERQDELAGRNVTALTQHSLHSRSHSLQPGTVGNADSLHTLHSFRNIVKNGYEYSAQTLDAVKENGTEFLDGNFWFPRGAVTIMCGRRRCGKSTLCLYYAAKFSKQGYRVLIVQREDGLNILKARLNAMGADFSNIRTFCKMKEFRGKTTELAFDADDLEAIIDVAEESRPDFVVVDPLHGLAQGDVNKQTSADCIPPLLAMCQRLDCNLVGVMHPGKYPANVESAVSGNEQWAAKARSLVYLETYPADADSAIAQQVDASYSDTENRAVTFRTLERMGDNGKPFTVRIVTEVERTDMNAQDLLDMRNAMRAEPVDPDQKSEVAQWLHDTIHEMGNHAFSTDVQKKAKAKGWTINTLRGAYREAGVSQTRQSKLRGRVVLFLTDAADYCEADRQKFKAGATPEQVAKEWTGDDSNDVPLSEEPEF